MSPERFGDKTRGKQVLVLPYLQDPSCAKEETDIGPPGGARWRKQQRFHRVENPNNRNGRNTTTFSNKCLIPPPVRGIECREREGGGRWPFGTDLPVSGRQHEEAQTKKDNHDCQTTMVLLHRRQVATKEDSKKREGRKRWQGV